MFTLKPRATLIGLVLLSLIVGNLGVTQHAAAVDNDSCQVTQGDAGQNNINQAGSTVYYDITNAANPDSNFSGINKLHIKYDPAKYNVTNANMIGYQGQWHYDSGDTWIEGFSISNTHTGDKTVYFTVTPIAGGSDQIEFRASDNNGYSSGTNELCNSSGISWQYTPPAPATCPEGQTGTPPDCVTTPAGDGDGDGGSTDTGITPRDVQLISFGLVCFTGYKFIIAMRYKGND